MSRFIIPQVVKTSSILIFSFSTTAIVQAQSPGFSVIRDQFENYRENMPQEKIYAHTDKNVYLAGEILWFKIYNVDASFHQFLDISKLAYVEVLDKDHKPVIQTKISLNEGLGNGSFSLPVDLNSGNYVMRAYTNWMKNFGADFFFEKPITIINTIKTEPINATSKAQNSYDIQFFPEGGNLVNGIESTVGFRAVDQFGRGYDLAGVVANNNSDTILSFQSTKFGIGNFKFTPISGIAYKAFFRLPNGDVVIKELPQPFNEGYVMHLHKAAEDKIHITVKTSKNLTGQNVYLFVHSRQQIIETLSASVANDGVEFTVDEKKLGDGISHFTVFNSEKQPVCERLFFKRPAKQLLIDAFSNQKQIESRKKVLIDIETKDEKGNTKIADLSMAVYRLDSLNISQENIFSYLWLGSDLKGEVESPEYYFANPGADTDISIDNLMLTHGWRRFKWEEVLKFKTPFFAFVPEYEGHIVSGVVFNKETNLPAKNVQSFLAIPDSSFRFFAGQSDENGNVNFYTKDFYGPREIFAQAGGRERLFRIDIKSPFFESYSSRTIPPFSLSSVSGHLLQANSVSMQVQNIYVADKLNKTLSAKIDTNLFYVPTRTYLLDNYVRFPTMEEVLREYVQEVAVTKQNNKLILAGGRRDAAGILYRYEPLVLLDGIPLFDNPNKIFAFDPLKIKELQIVNQRYFLGTAIFEGLLSYKTYTGRPEGLEIDPNATVLDYEGLQLQREFYTPVYETQNQVTSRMPDFRNLLYWNATVKTNSSGKQQLSFYTSDLAGKYIVVIEGLSADGRAGSRSFTIDVINPLFVQN